MVVAGLLALAFAQRPKPRADFVFVNRGEVSSIDPATMSWQQDFRVGRALYEGLTTRDVRSPGYEARAGVAERWEVGDDGRVYTFFLRADARWSNGEAVTSHDFVYSWRRMLLPENGADYVQLFFVIRGAKEFHDRRLAALRAFAGEAGVQDRLGAAGALWTRTEREFEALVGVKAIDDRTLRVELERATPYFLDLTSFGSFVAVNARLVRAHESLDAATGQVRTDPAWTRPGRFVGNGAFVLESWAFKREMRLRRNEAYWDLGRVEIESIGIPSIEDPTAQILAFQTGAVDWVVDATTGYTAQMLEERAEFERERAAEIASLRGQGLDELEVLRRLPRDPRATIHAMPAYGTYFYNFACGARLKDGRPNPFADARVRRAFSMAIDRRALCERVRRTGEPPATTLIPPGSIGGYRSPRGVGFEPEAARELLARAGYPGGAGLPMIEIVFNKEGGNDVIAQAVARDWERHLGVRVMLDQRELKVFREKVKSGDFMVSRASWFGDYGDPTTFLDINRTGNGNNDRGYSNAAYDALLDRAAEERDAEARMRLLEEAERMLVEEEMPLAPIFTWGTIQMFDVHRVEGLSAHPRQEQDLSRVRVRR